MADRITVDTYAEVDLTLVVTMGTYGSEWDMTEMFKQVMKEAEERVRNIFSEGRNQLRVSDYRIKKIKATAGFVTKERT